MIRYKLDRSESCIVGICREPGCGFRTLSSTKEGALFARAQHEATCHMKRGRRKTRRQDADSSVFA